MKLRDQSKLRKKLNNKKLKIIVLNLMQFAQMLEEKPSVNK